MKRLFPLRVIRARGETSFVLLDFSWNPEGWMVSLLSVAVLLGWRWKRKRLMCHLEDVVLVLIHRRLRLAGLGSHRRPAAAGHLTDTEGYRMPRPLLVALWPFNVS